MINNQYLKIGLLILISLLLVKFIAFKINFMVIDFPRHLKYGEIIWQRKSIPTTNEFSYTFPDYPFVHASWLSGVIFFPIFQLFGFDGLSIFFIIISLATLYLFLKNSLREGDIRLITLIFIIALPVIASRKEIRGEMFTYLFSGLFLTILNCWYKTKISSRWLGLLPLCMLLWVNLHLYFIFGFVLIGLFLSDSLRQYLMNRNKLDLIRMRQLAITLIVCFLFSLVNPNFIKGSLYPLLVFQNYAYEIEELRSVFFLDRVGVFPVNTYFKILYLVFVLSWIYNIWQQKINQPKIKIFYSISVLVQFFIAWILLKHYAFYSLDKIPIKFILVLQLILASIFIIFTFKKRQLKFNSIYFYLSLILSTLAWFAIRNFALFALFSLPIMTANFKNISTWLKRKPFTGSAYVMYFGLLISLGLLLYLIKPIYWVRFQYSGIGLLPNVNKAAEFFKANDLQSPIFNTYEVGAYLTYHLFPKHLVFIDGRPEAYPGEFFTKIYYPIMNHEEVWLQTEKAYQFNTIFLWRHNPEQWQQFIISRIKDESWALVYVDEYALIMVKRNQANREIIAKYEYPKDKLKIKV